MKWPELVPDAVCKTSITVRLCNGINSDGGPKYTTVYQGKCNYSEKSRQVLDAQRQLVRLEARALFNGDIAPGMDMSGKVIVSGAGTEITREIYSASRGRNPDGTVNFTQLELV